MQDKYKAGRENQPIGEKSGMSKLTAQDVIGIRNRANGNRVALGREFGVCRDNIGKVVRRETWKHI